MKRMTVLLLALVMAVGLAAYPAAAEESTLVISWVENVSSMNPFLFSNQSDFVYFGLIYEPLCMPLQTGEVEPWLAESWEYDQAARTWTFHMDPDAKWSDGLPVTAKDVAFTFNTSWKYDLQLGSSVKSAVDKLEVVDDSTIKFYLNNNYPGFVTLAGATQIVPEHILGQVADIAAYENLAPVGSGPYLFSEFVRTSHIALSRNAGYWNGSPTIDTVIFRDFGESQNAVLNFQSGELDILPELAGLETLATTVAAFPDTQILEQQGSGIMYLALNFRQEPLNVLEVRQAFNAVVDKQELIDICFSGYAEMPLMGYFAPVNAKWADPSVTWTQLGKDQETRTAYANGLLDGLGYAKGADGIRLCNGERMSYTIHAFSAYPSYVRAAELIGQYLMDIGIEITVVTADARTLFGELVYNSEGADKWDMMYHGSTLGSDPSNFAAEYAPDSDLAYYNANAFGWVDQELQDLIRSTNTEMDTAKRVETIREVQKQFAQKLVVISMGHRKTIAAYHTDKFTGFNPVPVNYGSMKNPLCSIQNIISMKPVQ